MVLPNALLETGWRKHIHSEEQDPETYIDLRRVITAST